MHRILVLTAGGLLAVGAALLPTAYYQNIPTARYVTASTQPGTESVSCSGQILAFDRAETYITSPVVTEDVLVEVGDQAVQQEQEQYPEPKPDHRRQEGECPHIRSVVHRRD